MIFGSTVYQRKTFMSGFLTRRQFLKTTSVLAVAGVAAACAPPAATSGPAEEMIEIVFVTTDSSDSSAALYGPIKDEFREENPNIDIKFLGIVGGGGWGSYFDKLSVTIAGGETVDMGKIPTEGGRLAVARGLVRPLDEYIEATTELDAYFEDVSPELAEVFVYGGKTYGLPYDYNNMMIWFNVNRLAEEGLEMPPEDWTFSDFREYAAALTKRDGNNTTHYGFSFWTAPFGLCPWLFNNGLEGMMGGGDDLSVPLQDDPAYAEVIQFLYDLMYVDESVPKPDAPLTGNFEAGTQAMLMAGRWPLTGFLQNEFRDWDVQYWPQGSRRVTEVGCGSWPIFQASQHPEAAWKFETKLLQQESIAYIVSTGANIPSLRSVGYADDFVNLQDRSGRLWYESIDREDIPVMSVTSPPDFSEMEQISNRFLSQVFADELGISEALNSTREELQAMVDRRPEDWAAKFA
jgi:multiple sugar transport system substrate-binding protein